MQVQDIIDAINTDAEANKLLWVTACAEWAWPVLRGHLDDLHPTARTAVEHYIGLEQR